MSTQNLVILISAISFSIGVIVILIMFRFYKRKLGKIKKSELDSRGKEMSIPLLAGFLGNKYLPSIIALGKNNINPKLSFLQDGIEYKVFGKKYKKYSDIVLVDILITLGTRNLIFKFRNSIFTFTGNLYDENNLENALVFLEKKNCPLSPKAKEFLTK